MDAKQLAARLRELEANATPGPWAVESSGEKGDGSDLIGVVFGPDDEDCEKPLAGRIRPFDDEGNEIDYYRDELVAECEHRNRNSYGDSELIVALRNNLPMILSALEDAERLSWIESSLAEVSPFSGDTDPYWHVDASKDRRDELFKIGRTLREAIDFTRDAARAKEGSRGE